MIQTMRFDKKKYKIKILPGKNINIVTSFYFLYMRDWKKCLGRKIIYIYIYIYIYIIIYSSKGFIRMKTIYMLGHF